MAAASRLCASLLAAAALGACDEEPGPPPPLDVGERLGPGQVRAGVVVREDQLVGGPAAKGRVGDVKLYNARVAFLIEQAGPSDGYDPYGGKPIAADLVRAPGEPGESLFGEVFFLIGGRIPRIEAVEVVHDGRDGKPAVVRATGVDEELPILPAATGTSLFPPLGGRYVLEYTLAPDDDALQIVVSVFPHQELAATAYFGFIMGDGLRSFIPGAGFAPQTRAVPYWALVGEKVSYAMLARGALFTPAFFYQGLLLGTYGLVTAAGGGEARQEYVLSVGAGDLGPHLLRHARETGEKLEEVSGVVKDAAGVPVPGARVHAAVEGGARDGEAAAFLRAGADGTFRARLPRGIYRLAAVADGCPPAGSVAADLSAGPAAGLVLPVGQAGTLGVEATEGGAPVPAKITVQPLAPGPALPESWGEGRLRFGAERMEFAVAGQATMALAPGAYRVTVSRGMEYDRVQEEVTVAAGAETRLRAALSRVVDTTGWVSGDFHIHALRSTDSNDHFPHKVAAFAAEGVEVPCLTEHDFIADLRPTVAALGLASRMHAMVGLEMSSTLGHMNAYPLVPRTAPNGGAPDWYLKSTPALVAALRALGASVVQLNHPMGGGLWVTSPMDPATGHPLNPSDPNWTEDYDVIEVLNKAGTGTTLSSVMPRWFALLNRGKRVGGVGNSDSHRAQDDHVGRPRTFIASPTDDPGTLEDAALMASMKAMAMTVSAGPFLTATVSGHGPGAVVVEPGEVAVRVRVQAPLWMGPMREIELLGNGTVVAVVDAADPRWKNDQVLRFDGEIRVSPARDTWYLVRVVGEDGDPMAPVYGGRTFAFTNPIYVDRHGDGFTAPLP